MARSIHAARDIDLIIEQLKTEIPGAALTQLRVNYRPMNRTMSCQPVFLSKRLAQKRHCRGATDWPRIFGEERDSATAAWQGVRLVPIR